MWITGKDLHSINQIRWGVGAGPHLTLGRLLWRTARARFLKERIASRGAALVARLRLALDGHGVPICYETPLSSLIVENGSVGGVVVGDDAELRAQAVVLATGGFSHDHAFRSTFQPDVPGGWSLASADDLGEGHRAAIAAGAATAQMDEAWWHPVVDLPGGPGRTTAERQYPGQFIVGLDGNRFCNEALPYTAFGRKQLESKQVTAWMITDERAIRRNILFAHFPLLPLPADWIASGRVKRATSIEQLAALIDVPAPALAATVQRFNDFARAGHDEDFYRGETVYENY
jgi:succinate dehydrogenase/fumarate reductase flavoprotein subunit